MMKPAAAALIVCTLPAWADSPLIESVRATEQAHGWRFDVSISHPDTGWDHYADGWRVLDMTGRELGLRVLYHPHVNEQPFTRALTGVTLPDGTKQVQIQARCLVDGWSEAVLAIDIE